MIKFNAIQKLKALPLIRLYSFFLFLLTFIFSLSSPSQSQAAYQYVKVQGRQLLVDFEQDGQYLPYIIKGVGYSPFPISRHPSDWGWPNVNDPRPDNIFNDPTILHRDFTLLQAMHANTIRIWGGQDQTEPDGRFPVKLTSFMLDTALAYNIHVIAGFWINPAGEFVCTGNGSQYQTYIDLTNPTVRNDLLTRFGNYVTAFKNHPAILFWSIGNENNLFLNGNNPVQLQAWYSLVNEMAQLAHTIEGPTHHPVAVINGDLGFIGSTIAGASDAQMPHLDIWGSNIYRGSSFGTLFTEYAAKSNKPFWIAEFGLESWHSLDLNNPQNGYEDQLTQASWDGRLWNEIVDNQNTTIGGTVMEYADEWWKPYEWLCDGNSPACNVQHNHFGHGPLDSSCPSDGVPDWTPPTPDHFFNAEWFGIASIASNPLGGFNYDAVSPKKAYYFLQEYFHDSKLWETFRGSNNRTGWNAAETQLTAPLTKLWSALRGDPFLADSNLTIESSPVIADGRVYVATLEDFNFPSTHNSSLIALDLNTGAVLWSTPLGSDGIWSTPSIDDQGRIFVAAWDGYVYALNRTTGAILWSTQLTATGSRELRASPFVSNGRVYIGTYKGTGNQLYVLNANSGAILNSRLLAGGVYSSPVSAGVDRMTVVVSLPNGESQMETYDISSPTLTAPLWTRAIAGDSWSTPVFTRGYLIHRSGRWLENIQEGLVYVIDAQTGSNVVPPYSLPGSYWSSPAVDDTHIYTSTQDTLYALNFNKILNQTPNPIDWTFTPADHGAIAGSPAVANGFVYFGTDDTGYPEGVFYALRATDGQEVWHDEANNGLGSAQSSPAIADGKIVFVSYDDDERIDHGVFAFTSQTGGGNQPPVFNAITNPTVNENQLLSFTVSAVDPEGLPLSYGAVSLPAGASFNTATRTFSWTPSFTQAGSYTVTFKVTDDVNIVSKNVMITVVNINRPPVANAGIDKSGVTTVAIALSGSSSSDPDGDPLTYSWNFGDGTALASGVNVSHAYSTAGNFTVTLTVSDGNLTGSDTALVTVTGANIVLNPNFESAKTSWTGWGTPVKLVTASPFEGTSSVEMTLAAGGVRDLTQIVSPVTAGQKYQAKAAIKTAAVTSQSYVQLEWRKSGGALIRTDTFGQTTGTNAWAVKTSPVFTAPTGAAKVTVKLISDKGTGKAYFDAVELRQVP